MNESGWAGLGIHLRSTAGSPKEFPTGNYQMVERTRKSLLPWILCRFFLVVAGLIMLLILVSPFLDDGRPNPERGYRLIAIIARDLAVRRTAIAASAGLAATAWIFFRPKLEAGFPIRQFQENDSIHGTDL
jgi:hypothetical protein